jgi:hypothetical protein
MLWIVGINMSVHCLYFYDCVLICTGIAVDFLYWYVCGLFASVCLRIFWICIEVIFLDWLACELFVLERL